MINLIDIYLRMNSCERDSSNNIYYVDLSKSKKEKVGRIKSSEVKDGELKLEFESDKDLKFINVSTTVSKSNV